MAILPFQLACGYWMFRLFRTHFTASFTSVEAVLENQPQSSA